MSNFWMVVNIIVLLGLIVYAIGYKRSPKKHYKQNKEENRFRIYQAEEDPQIRDFRRSNFITSHPDDADRDLNYKLLILSDAKTCL